MLQAGISLQLKLLALLADQAPMNFERYIRCIELSIRSAHQAIKSVAAPICA